MNATEMVINDLNAAKLTLCNPQALTPEMCVRIGQAITSAIDLLKEQNNCENCAITIEDRQPVVRCKDCKHSCDYTDIYPNRSYKCIKNGCFHDGGWFCADAEKCDDDG